MTAAVAAKAVRTRRGPRPGYWTGRVVIYVTVVTGAFLYSIPLVWMLSTSFKPGYQVYTTPPQWIPDVWNWENYTQPWRDLPFALFYMNTAFVTVTDILATLASSSIVAFAFARMRFRGRDPLFLVVLATMMLPGQVTLIPHYVFWAKLGLVNTLWPLIIPYFFSHPFNIFLLRQYMLTIPLEMDDAARIDGASWLQVYYRIVLPMSGPALGVVAIFAFTHHWNDFLGPLLYLNDPKNFTIPLGLALLNTRQSVEIQRTMAQTVLAVIPVLTVFFLAQRHYIQGVVITGVKG